MPSEPSIVLTENKFPNAIPRTPRVIADSSKSTKTQKKPDSELDPPKKPRNNDGRTMITDTNVNVNDVCLLEIPKQKIVDVIKFEKNSQVIITQGTNAGRIGTINEIKEGTFTLPKRISLLIDDNTVEIPASITMVIGKEKPILQIKQENVATN